MTRILLIAGDQSLKKTLHDTLEASGVCEIDVAGDETTAMTRVQRYSYDLVIVDLMNFEAPEPGFREFSEKLEKNTSKRTKILALTDQSNISPPARKGLRDEMGYDACLRRPVPQTKLIQELNTLLT